MKSKIKIKCDCKMPKCWIEVDIEVADKSRKQNRVAFVSIKNFTRKKPVEMVLNEEGIKDLVKFLEIHKRG